MTKVMVAVDLPIHWQVAPFEYSRILGNVGCAHLKFHDPYPTLSLPATVQAARRFMKPGLASQIMFDNKEHDTRDRVVKAVINQRMMGFDLCTVHASGGSELFKELRSAELIPYVVAVTVLTSMSEDDVIGVYGEPRHIATPRLARIAARHGVTKFVCAVDDIKDIKPAISGLCDNPEFLTPGIRPDDYDDPNDDQVEVATPSAAKAAGATTLIIGRPINSHPRLNPGEAVQAIRATLD